MLWKALNSRFNCHVVPHFPSAPKPSDGGHGDDERSPQVKKMDLFFKKLGSNSLFVNCHEFEAFLGGKEFLGRQERESLVSSIRSGGQALLNQVNKIKTHGYLSSIFAGATVNEKLKENKERLVGSKARHSAGLERLSDFLNTLLELRQENQAFDGLGNFKIENLAVADLVAPAQEFDSSRAIVDERRRAFFKHSLSEKIFLLQDIKGDLEGLLEREVKYLELIQQASSQKASAEKGHETQLQGLKQESDILLVEAGVFDEGMASNIRKIVEEFHCEYRKIEFCQA